MSIKIFRIVITNVIDCDINVPDIAALERYRSKLTEESSLKQSPEDKTEVLFSIKTDTYEMLYPQKRRVKPTKEI